MRQCTRYLIRKWIWQNCFYYKKDTAQFTHCHNNCYRFSFLTAIQGKSPEWSITILSLKCFKEKNWWTFNTRKNSRMIHYNFITKMFQRKISSLLFSSVRALVKRKLGKEPEVDPMNSYHYRSSVTHSHFDFYNRPLNRNTVVWTFSQCSLQIAMFSCFFPQCFRETFGNKWTIKQMDD